jgi:hypothetical protein
MEKTILCLSYLNGQFKAMAVHKGTVVGTWERSGVQEDFTDFSTVLTEAVDKTRYVGSNVALVLAHPRLTQQLVEVPPVKGWNLERYIQRRVTQLKTFEAEASWSYQPTLPTKNAKALLLHILPKPLLNELVQGCQEAGLRLLKILPTTSILHSQLMQLPLEKDEIALLAAETNGTTTVVIGRNDGQIYLGRTLSNSWNHHPERVVLDLNRTILYVKQQFGATVNSLWLFGAGSHVHVPVMQSLVRTPVKASPVEATPFYWNENALKLPFKEDSNLISAEVQQAPKRRLLFQVIAFVVVFLALASLATAAFVERLVRNNTRTIAEMKPKITRLAERKRDLEHRYTDLMEKKKFVKTVNDQRIPPVPGWFLAYLGEVIPEELLLTHMQVKREDDQWAVQLAGALQPTTNREPARLMMDAVSALAKNLASGPFHLKITRSTIGQGADRSASAGDQNAEAVLPLEADDADKYRFFLEGVMR